MIKIICVGKIKEKYIKDAILEYFKRLSKYTKLDIIEVPEYNIYDSDTNKNKEALEILKHIDPKDYVITLEIDGKELTSLQLSKKINETFNTNPSIAFIIGGSEGLSSKVSSVGDFKLSFSKLTFPHQLFRIFLLEQIYRSYKIINNETYHK